MAMKAGNLDLLKLFCESRYETEKRKAKDMEELELTRIFLNSGDEDLDTPLHAAVAKVKRDPRSFVSLYK